MPPAHKEKYTSMAADAVFWVAVLLTEEFNIKRYR